MGKIKPPRCKECRHAMVPSVDGTIVWECNEGSCSKYKEPFVIYDVEEEEVDWDGYAVREDT